MDYEVALVKNLKTGDRIFLRNQEVKVVNNFGPMSCFGMIGFGRGHIIIVEAHKWFFKKSIRERIYKWWIKENEQSEYLAEDFPVVRIKKNV